MTAAEPRDKPPTERLCVTLQGTCDLSQTPRHEQRRLACFLANEEKRRHNQRPVSYAQVWAEPSDDDEPGTWYVFGRWEESANGYGSVNGNGDGVVEERVTT